MVAIKFPSKDDPWQIKIPEDLRVYSGVCSYMIEMDYGYTHYQYGDECHARAYPNAGYIKQYYDVKWSPVSVTTDLRFSKKYAKWYELILDEKISPYRNGPIKGRELIVGDDGFLRAVRLTNMDCSSQEMLNFLVMTRMPYEFPKQVDMFLALVQGGVSPHASMMACHLFNLKNGKEYTRTMWHPGHQAMNFNMKGLGQPSVKRLIEARPDAKASTYRMGGNPAGFSDIWGDVGKDDPRLIYTSSSPKNKAVVAVYKGSFPVMFNRVKGDEMFGLSKPAADQLNTFLLDNIIAAAPQWSQL